VAGAGACATACEPIVATANAATAKEIIERILLSLLN
jgi:hypothetical protein